MYQPGSPGSWDSRTRKRWKAHESRHMIRGGVGGSSTGCRASAGAECTAAEKRPSNGQFQRECSRATAA